MATSDEIERQQWLQFVEQILADAASNRASEILFRPERERVQVFMLVDGKYEKGLTIPMGCWGLVIHILKEDYLTGGQHQLYFQGSLVDFQLHEDGTDVVRLKVARKPFLTRQTDGIEDIFRSFEDKSWDAIKSICLSILNLALEQKFDGITMELSGQVVNIEYRRKGEKMTSMMISSDTYDALSRLIGENYLAFGFMTREFREKEYLIRLKELNEDIVAPRIRLEIEEF